MGRGSRGTARWKNDRIAAKRARDKRQAEERGIARKSAKADA